MASFSAAFVLAAWLGIIGEVLEFAVVEFDAPVTDEFEFIEVALIDDEEVVETVEDDTANSRL